jgi:hypothetical protein
MAQDPLSHVASWLTTPAQAGSADKKVVTLEELAAVEFEPIDLSAKLADPAWSDEWRRTGAFIHLALVGLLGKTKPELGLLGKTKPELTEAVASILDKDDGERLYHELTENLQTTQQRLQDFVEMLHAVEIRCLVTGAALCLREDSAA